VLQRDDLLIDALRPFTAAEAVTVPVQEKSVFNSAKRQAGLAAALSALEATHWNRKEAAGLLKMDYKTFLYHLKKLGVVGKKTLRN
jgi:DNA-binding NtrC family response regulator